MTIAAVAVAATMNAQVYVGGNIGVSSVSEPAGDGTETTTKVSFSPEVGYMFNDKMGVGMQLTIGTQGEVSALNSNGDYSKKTPTTIGFAPYFRYKFVNSDNLDVFVDAQVFYENTNVTKYGNSYYSNATNTFGFAIKPGVAYKATDHISFVAKVGLLGFKSSKPDIDGAKATNTFNFMVGSDTFSNSTLSFGIFYNF